MYNIDADTFPLNWKGRRSRKQDTLSFLQDIISQRNDREILSETFSFGYCKLSEFFVGIRNATC